MLKLVEHTVTTGIKKLKWPGRDADHSIHLLLKLGLPVIPLISIHVLVFNYSADKDSFVTARSICKLATTDQNQNECVRTVANVTMRHTIRTHVTESPLLGLQNLQLINEPKSLLSSFNPHTRPDHQHGVDAVKLHAPANCFRKHLSLGELHKGSHFCCNTERDTIRNPR